MSGAPVQEASYVGGVAIHRSPHHQYLLHKRQRVTRRMAPAFAGVRGHARSHRDSVSPKPARYLWELACLRWAAKRPRRSRIRTLNMAACGGLFAGEPAPTRRAPWPRPAYSAWHRQCQQQCLPLTHVIAPSRFLTSLTYWQPSKSRHRDYQEAPAMFRASTT